MESARCQYCASLSIAVLRFNTTYSHHGSLADLKKCAEKNSCDICVLFWASILKQSSPADINLHLSYASDGRTDRDINIYLWAYLQDSMVEYHQVTQSGSNILVSSGSIGDITMTPQVSGFVELFAEPGSLAAQHMYERNSFCAGGDSIKIADLTSNKWLKACQSRSSTHHKSCGGTTPTRMPTRVVDIGEFPEEKTRLFVTHGCLGRYMALSYSWGNEVRHQVKLGRNTLETFQTEIPTLSMTLSHREALDIARSLDYRYIWIDALCIIQGDKDDWAREAVKIADVYGNAELTIVAGRSNDSREGFRKYKDTPSVSPCRVPYSRTDTNGSVSELGTCLMGLKRSPAIGPVEQRAWCFQETMLSRRCIFYGEQQLRFKCQRQMNLENGMHWRWAAGENVRFELSSQSVIDKGLTKADILQRWYELAGEYCIREFWDPTDAFAALSGVASRFEQALGCRYLAGLWEGDLVRGLLWRSRRLMMGPHSSKLMKRPVASTGQLKGREIIRAPSWSWLSLEGASWQVIGQRAVQRLYDSSAHYCRPAEPNGTRWSPDDWGPRVVKDFPLPCRLELLGRPREVQLSKKSMAEYGKKPQNWSAGTARLNKFTVLLEAKKQTVTREAPPDPQTFVVAVGFFDLTGSGSSNLWALRLTSDEGLLLEQNEDGCFSRLGLFAVEDEEWFSQVGDSRIVILQ